MPAATSDSNRTAADLQIAIIDINSCIARPGIAAAAGCYDSTATDNHIAFTGINSRTARSGIAVTAGSGNHSAADLQPSERINTDSAVIVSRVAPAGCQDTPSNGDFPTLGMVG